MVATAGQKDPGALLTIGELSLELGVPQHILRYWETRFPQLKPMQRAGNRRYYRPADVELARRINRLLNQEGYTVRGVQKLLRDRAESRDSPPQPTPVHLPLESAAPEQNEITTAQVAERPEPQNQQSGVDVSRLITLRNRLANALDT